MRHSPRSHGRYPHFRTVLVAGVAVLLLTGASLRFHAPVPGPLGAPLLLYIGPDLLLPLTSALAAGLGVVLMFWNRLVARVRVWWRMLLRRKP